MTTTPEYTRRVIAPTATAEQLAERLTAALVDSHLTYIPLIAASLAAVNAATGFEVA